MRYLIICNIQPPAYTEWFQPENHFNKEAEMIVIDLATEKYMDDGETWKEIKYDHL